MYFFDIEKHKLENFNFSDYKVFDLRYNLDKNLKNIIPFIYFNEEKTQYSAVVLQLKSEYISKIFCFFSIFPKIFFIKNIIMVPWFCA